MSWYPILYSERQSGYGGQSWLLSSIGVLSPWSQISDGISPVS